MCACTENDAATIRFFPSGETAPRGEVYVLSVKYCQHGKQVKEGRANVSPKKAAEMLKNNGGPFPLPS